MAVTAASNAVGTVPELAAIVAAAHGAGARVYVDAVHAAPHRALEVEALGADALVCSAYKWFGPHVGILWGRPELLAELAPDKLRPSPDTVPDRWELGTLPFEALTGVRAAADFMAALDRDALRAYEDALLAQLVDGLSSIAGVTLHGAARDRTPTVMFSVEGRDLGRRGPRPGPRARRRLARPLLRPRARPPPRAGARRRRARRRGGVHRRGGRAAAGRGGGAAVGGAPAQETSAGPSRAGDAIRGLSSTHSGDRRPRAARQSVIASPPPPAHGPSPRAATRGSHARPRTIGP